MIFLAGLTVICVAALFFVRADAILWAYLFGILQLLAVALAFRLKSLARVRMALQGYAMALTAISLICYQASVSIGTAEAPYLLGDGEGYFAQARELLHGGLWDQLQSIRSNYLGFQFVLAALFRATQADLMVGLALNNTLIVASVVLLAKATLLMRNEPGAALYAALAFILTTKFVFYSNGLMKEPFLTFGVALVVFGYVSLATAQKLSPMPYLYLAAATVIFATMRVPMLVLLPLGLVCLGRQFVRRGWLLLLVGAVGITSAMSIFANFTTYEFTSRTVTSTAVANRVLDKALESGVDAGGVVGRVMGGYTSLPVAARIIGVPVPAILQYVLPFDFWSTKFIEDHIMVVFNTNLNPIWYGYVGVFALFTILYWRWLPSYLFQSMFAIGLAMYLLIAFVFGGAVPRYASPYLVFMYPAIGYWMHSWQQGGRVAASLTRFFALFYMAFGVAGLAYVVFQFTRIF